VAGHILAVVGGDVEVQRHSLQTVPRQVARGKVVATPSDARPGSV
jgi:hypothetical protein